MANNEDASIGIGSDVTKHTEKLERDMETAMKHFNEDAIDTTSVDTELQQLIQTMVDKEIQPIHDEFNTKRQELDAAITKYNVLSIDPETTQKTVRTTRENFRTLNKQINTTLTFITRKKTMFTNNLKDIKEQTTTLITETETKLNVILQQVDFLDQNKADTADNETP